MPPKNLENCNMKKIIIALVLVLIIIALTDFNDKEYTVTVTDKERVTYQKGDRIENRYLVYCKDKNGNIHVFENTDCLFRWKFNSSDVYAKLEEGKEYKLTVVGYRIPVFSCYENIVKVE